MELTQAILRQLVSYDERTGVFVWKPRANDAAWTAKMAGKQCGAKRANGYIASSIFGRRYYAHRLAWLYVYGCWPKEVDHINGDRADNRLVNLRECTRAENCQNMPVKSSNTSGYPGVSWHKQMAKWAANITINKKHLSLGLFASKEEAFAAYLQAKREIHLFNPTQRVA